MAGNITKLDDRRWRVRIHLGYDENGKRQDFTKVIHGLKKDADRFLRDALRRKDLGEDIDPDESTLSTFLDTWLAVKKKSVRPSTFERYTSAVELHIRPTLGKMQIRRITTPDVQAAYAKIMKHVSVKSRKKPRPMGPHGLHKVHAVLHGVMEFAVKLRLRQDNPVRFAVPDKIPHVEREHFDAETGRAFLEAAHAHPRGIVFILAIATGMRPQEYLALKWTDLDWNTRRLTVRRTLCRHLGGGWNLEEGKTAKSRRTIVLPPEVMDMLKSHKAKQDEAKALAQNLWQDHGFILTGEFGQPLQHTKLSLYTFRPILRAAGLPETLRPYDLRHACATIALEAGADMKDISEQLGHASIRVTADVYAHHTSSMKDRTANRIGQALFGKPCSPAPSTSPDPADS